ncbi:winged helix-turn-helix domain-containing protein [Sulfurospirillum sp. UCH001]|uniref:winged helix-turn-helix domain-containing protein n=1 Tax=Sulfurospirillum sp. UCH001 TaxID=1581011 RepID=UPI0009E7AF5E|nr:winged helix-turn-helix domain-containing protein [Sulfurospirillum sp. UCH001]
MKVFLLEPDGELADSMDVYLNSLRLKMKIKKVKNEEALFAEDVSLLPTYALFILNLKNPVDPTIMHYLREHGVDVPILLIIESTFDTKDFKTLYYLSYDDMIVKPFTPQEIAFRIYKLCDIWNDDTFFVTKDVYFDFKHAKFVNRDEEVILGRKEALLLKLLFMKSHHVVSSHEIEYYVYQDEAVSEERIRSLIRQLRAKLLPFHFIETVKGEGYKIIDTKIEEPSSVKEVSRSAIMSGLCLPWLPLADCSLFLL